MGQRSQMDLIILEDLKLNNKKAIEDISIEEAMITSHSQNKLPKSLLKKVILDTRPDSRPPKKSISLENVGLMKIWVELQVPQSNKKFNLWLVKKILNSHEGLLQQQLRQPNK
jgi:hypothetical protein